MKKIVVLILALFIVTSILPAFAAEGVKSSKAPTPAASGQTGEKTLFQIAGDTMKEPYKVPDKDKIKIAKEVDVFQKMSDYLKDASAKAKDHSLRGKDKGYQPPWL